MSNRYDELTEVWEDSPLNKSDNDCFSDHENDRTYLLVFADWLDNQDDYCDLGEYLRIVCEHMETHKTDLETACNFEEMLADCESEDIDPDNFREYAEYVGIDFATIGDFNDKFQGEWDSLAEYVENYWDDIGFKGDDNWWHPTNYIDWERMAHDLELSGDIFTIEVERPQHYPGLGYVGTEHKILVFNSH